MRYFITEDEDMKAKALPEVRQVMNSLLISSYITIFFATPKKLAESPRWLSRSCSSQELIGLMV